MIKRDKKPTAIFYLTGKQIIDALEESHAQDKMSDNLATHFILLIDRISTHHHFSGYSFLDDMKSHAMENLVRNWRTFKYKEEQCNPFAYFTSAIRNSFIQEIKKFHKHEKIKQALILEIATAEQLLQMFQK